MGIPINCCCCCIASLVGINKQKNTRKFAFLTRTPRSHVKNLIYHDDIDIADPSSMQDACHIRTP